MKFHSKIELGTFMKEFTEEEVKAEPMFFNADLEFSYRMGGPITRDFLDALEGPEPVVFDSRVHMLMPGWIPAIPGWHHDDVPRSKGGQPDYESPVYLSRHALALVNGSTAPTQFAIGEHELPEPDRLAGSTYGQWHPIIDAQLKEGILRMTEAPSNVVIYFDWQSMHRAVPAVKQGWRWFGRASWQTDRKPTNEIRQQVQVYMPTINGGW